MSGTVADESAPDRIGHKPTCAGRPLSHSLSVRYPRPLAGDPAEPRIAFRASATSRVINEISDRHWAGAGRHRGRGRRPTLAGARSRRRTGDEAPPSPSRRHAVEPSPCRPVRWPGGGCVETGMRVVIGCRGCAGSSSEKVARYSAAARRRLSAAWIERTTRAPSPTAEATRLVDPLRTSPVAKMSGRVVSRSKGWWSPPSRCSEKLG